MTNIWHVDPNQNFNLNISKELCYSIFGFKINLEEIEWHKDKFSGFNYPIRRFDKLKVQEWFDKGTELKFPWELSRFYFGVSLGQKYLITKDACYYKTFRRLVLNWIEKNPFLYGVNWLSTMEVAIRSINWIVSVNYFFELIHNDEAFKNTISRSLLQHAEYIYTFPEIYENGLTTNHTTAGYAGLLFLGLSLKDHSKSKLWIDSAINGLEKCIKDQVYEDGANFEASIPYHRLVLELFAYSAIAALVQNIKFSDEYYTMLFRMFEFTSAYIDKNGNAPQVGDNDSGRSIILNSYDNANPYVDEHDHSYLLVMGEKIFEHEFASQCLKKDVLISKFLPQVKKINIDELKVIPRRTDQSIAFENSGSYFLKNERFSFLLSCYPIGQNGKGGHNHSDIGSFTLSINGKQVIIDPGTVNYTRDKKIRDKFRSYTYHNTLYTLDDEKINWAENNYWSLKEYHTYQLEKFTSQELITNIHFVNDKITRRREFKIESNFLVIHDFYNGNFFSRINLHPHVKLIEQEKNKITMENFTLYFDNIINYRIVDYDYSPHYGKSYKSQSVLISSNNFSKIVIVIDL